MSLSYIRTFLKLHIHAVPAVTAVPPRILAYFQKKADKVLLTGDGGGRWVRVGRRGADRMVHWVAPW